MSKHLKQFTRSILFGISILSASAIYSQDATTPTAARAETPAQEEYAPAEDRTTQWAIVVGLVVFVVVDTFVLLKIFGKRPKNPPPGAMP